MLPCYCKRHSFRSRVELFFCFDSKIYGCSLIFSDTFQASCYSKKKKKKILLLLISLCFVTLKRVTIEACNGCYFLSVTKIYALGFMLVIGTVYL